MKYCRFRELSGKRGTDIPYELLALEVGLSWGCRALDTEANEVDSHLGPLLETLAQKVNKGDLEDTRNLKSKLNRLAARASKVKQVGLSGKPRPEARDWGRARGGK